MPVSPRPAPAKGIAAIPYCCDHLSETAIDLPHIRDSQELLHRQRLDTSGISCLNMPGVEWIILGDMTDLMKADPSPKIGRAVAFCVPRFDRFARHVPQGSVYA